MSMRTSSALVVGEALVDIVVPLRGDRREYPGGSPANVAMTLGRLDRPVRLVTWLGEDARGRMVKDHLNESHVKITEESLGARQTSTALATLDASGAATYDFDLDWQVRDTQVDESVIVLHSGSIAATLEPGGSAVVDLMRETRAQATITYDPNARPSIMGSAKGAYARAKEIIQIADVVKTSDEDVAWLTGCRSVEEVAKEWLDMGVSVVVVTRGGEGAMAFSADAEVHLPASDVDVVDTVGAGDSFMGGLIDALWSENLLGAHNRYALQNVDEETLIRMLARAGSISAITVSRAGANPPWKKELI